MSETINIVIVDKKFETQALQGLVIRSEGNANTIKIQFPKVYEGEDLTTKMFILKCTNANATYFETILPKKIKNDVIELTWTVTSVFTTVSGILKVAVFAESANYSLGTQMSKVIVEESPQLTVPIDQYTVYEQYLKEIRVLADSTESYYEQTLVIKNDFESKIVDDLTSTEPQKILSANQGRVLDQRINNIVGQTGTSNTEIVDARNSPERGIVYPTLKARLDSVDGDIVKSKYSAPTTATAPIISLPSTAVKGKLEGSIKGNTLYQAVVNGDFSNGTSGWLSSGVAGFSVTNGIGKFTPNAQFGGIRIGSSIAGIKYLVFARVKVPATRKDVRLLIRTGQSIVIPNTNTFQNVIAIGTVTTNQPSIAFAIEDFGTGVFGEIEVDYLGVIPITGTPYENWTADQLNNLITGYWEGLGNSKASKVKSTWKNLFDKNSNNEFGFAYDSALNQSKVPNSTIFISDFIKVKPTTNYFKSGNSAGGVNQFFDKNKNWISGITVVNGILATPSNAHYIKCNIAIDSMDTIMLNEGSTALPYEPYQETELFAPVELGSVPNGIQDEFTFDGRYIQKTATKTNQTGVVNYSDMLTGGSFIAQLASGGIQIGVKGDTLTGTASVIRYQLATPVETQYPASNLIAEPSGTIYVDNVVTLTKQYKTGISVANKIKSINSIFMVNNNVKTPINLALVTIASDGMSLTILNANATNFYEVEYETFGATLPTIEYSYPSNLAGAVLGNTESIKEIDLTLASFISLQNAMNVEFDFRLTTGGH